MVRLGMVRLGVVRLGVCFALFFAWGMEFQRGHAGVDLHQGDLWVEVVEQILHGLFQVEPIGKDDMGIVQGAQIVGAGLVAVGVCADRQQLCELDRLSSYLADDIADQAGGGHHA